MKYVSARQKETCIVVIHLKTRVVLARHNFRLLKTQFKLFGISRVNPYSAGFDFSRQNLTSVDVRF